MRSHYQQYDGSHFLIGVAPVNSGVLEAGGDMGGQDLPSTSTVTQHAQGNQGLQIRP